MKLGVAHLNALELAPEELVQAAARAGFSAVGLRINPVAAGGICYPLKAGTEALLRIRTLLRSEGIGLNEVEFIELAPDTDISRFAWMLEAGAELGATCVTVAGEDPDHGRLVANFAALCDLAAPFGLRVDVEFMAWRVIGTIRQAEALVVEAARPNGAILVDALHLHRSGGTTADVRRLSPALVRAAQLCDAPADPPTTVAALVREAREDRLPPGQGALPLAELLAALPAGTAFSAEVPMPGLAPSERLSVAYNATSALLGNAMGR